MKIANFAERIHAGSGVAGAPYARCLAGPERATQGLLWTTVLLVVLGIVASPVIAQSQYRGESGIKAGDQPEMTARVEAVLADPASKKRALLAGRDRAIVCAYCHGKDGNSVKRIVPSLAAQHTDYLVDQLVAYAIGAREDFIMQGMMRDFTADDVVNITAFYRSQLPKPMQPTGKGDLVAGKQVYQQLQCFACHGADGTGGKRYPRIAGQSSEYLVRALQRYKDPKAQGKRNDATMSALAAALSDAQIVDLASWLESAP